MRTRMFYRAVDKALPTLRFVLLAAILGVMVAGGYYILAFPAPGNAGKWAIADDFGGEGVRGRIKAFQMAEKTSAEDRWNLMADIVSMKDDVKEMTEVRMRYFPAKKKGLELELSSRSAIVQNATNNIAFTGDVIVKTNGEMPSTLHTKTLNWNQQKRQIITILS